MKNLFIFFLFLSLNLLVKAQTITKAHFNVSAHSGQINSASLFINDWLLQISGDGEIVNYDYLPNGEITYYSSADGFDQEGKVKSIGGVQIQYYNRFDLNEKTGKIKSIGDMRFDYYDRFGNDDMQGKLKSIGNIKVDYYNKFDDTDLFKKLKTVGNIRISYYDKFGDESLIGMVRSISNVQMKYYGRLDALKRHGLQSIEGNTQNVYVTAW